MGPRAEGIAFSLFSDKAFLGAPAAAEGSENKQQVPLLARLPEGGPAYSLHGVKVGCVQGVRLEGVA